MWLNVLGIAMLATFTFQRVTCGEDDDDDDLTSRDRRAYRNLERVWEREERLEARKKRNNMTKAQYKCRHWTCDDDY